MKRASKLLSLLLALVMVLGLAVPAMAAEYTVVKGDNLSKIAKAYLGDATKWKEIYEVNKDKIKNPNSISVGQVLTLPEGAAETPIVEPGDYTIAKGDTLGKIAAAHGVTVEALMAANGLKNPNLIYAGKKLIIPATGAIVILHSNDVHGAVEGYAKMAALKAKYEAEGAYVLAMDAGDFAQGETSVSVSQGMTAITLMNMAGYDVAAPGNHEFDYGFDNLKKLERAANFPILAANITKDGAVAFGDNMTFTAPDGTVIGVFGLDTPETASKAHPGKIAGVKFAGGEELYAVAQAQVEALEAKGADYIICLAHLGIDDETAATANRSIDLLNNVTGIDVLIDGHSHSTEDQIAAKTDDTRTVNGTVITSTGTKFANIGVVTIKNGEIATDCVSTEGITGDETVAAEAAAIRAEIEADYGAVFAKTEVRLNGDRAPGNRTEETNLGNLITDSMLWKANAEGEAVDAAITNGGGIRATIEAGDITKNDVNTVLPFGNTLNIVKVSGSALLEILEASTYCTPTAIGGFPQVAGIEFTIDTTKEFAQGEQYGDTTYFAPATINRVSIQTVGGKEFDVNATYTIATNDFLATGGDTYYAFTTSAVNYDLGIPLDEVLMEYITEELGGVVSAAKYGATQGRITVK